MILLLGKNDVVEEYARDILKIDLNNDVVHYPDVTTHYTELHQYVDIAIEKNPSVITTQSLEMIDTLLASDLDFEVVTVIRDKENNVRKRCKTKEEAWKLRETIGIDLR